MQSERLPDAVKYLFQINPLSILITEFRCVLLDGAVFNLVEFLWLFVCITVLIQLGLVWVRMNSSQIVKML
jgi:ABC-type polysaccharide/polyol phosphate export permease